MKKFLILASLLSAACTPYHEKLSCGIGKGYGCTSLHEADQKIQRGETADKAKSTSGQMIRGGRLASEMRVWIKKQESDLSAREEYFTIDMES